MLVAATVADWGISSQVGVETNEVPPWLAVVGRAIGVGLSWVS